MDLFIQRSGGYYEIPNTIEGWLENKITLIYFPGYTLCSKIENELATITKRFERDALAQAKLKTRAGKTKNFEYFLSLTFK